MDWGLYSAEHFSTTAVIQILTELVHLNKSTTEGFPIPNFLSAVNSFLVTSN